MVELIQHFLTKMILTKREYNWIYILFGFVVTQSILYHGLLSKFGKAIDVVLGAVAVHCPFQEKFEPDEVVFVAHLLVDILLRSRLL